MIFVTLRASVYAQGHASSFR